MEINYFLLPIFIFGCYSFFENNNMLFNLLLITSVFTATSFINIGSKSFTISFFIGLLYILKTLFNVAKSKIKIKKRYINQGLIIFIFVCFLSIIFTFRIESDFKIISINSKEIYFNIDILNSFLHFLYLFYCYFIYLSVKINFYQEIENYNNKIEKSKKYFYVSLLIIIFISFYYYLDIYFYLKTGKDILKFNDIFRMNPVRLLQGIRLPGPNLEPSMFAIFLLTYFCILLNNKKAEIIILILGTLSTSSSFIVGIGIIFLYLLILGSKKEKIDILKMSIYLFFIAFLLLICFEDIRNIIFEIIEKFEGKNTSGIERRCSFLLMMNSFIKYPILGIGYATSRSSDLISTWLANIGILGMWSFLYGVYLSGKRVVKINKNLYRALLIYWIIAFISVPEPYFLYIWIIWGIIDSSPKINNKKLTIRESNKNENNISNTNI